MHHELTWVLWPQGGVLTLTGFSVMCQLLFYYRIYYEICLCQNNNGIREKLWFNGIERRDMGDNDWKREKERGGWGEWEKKGRWVKSEKLVQ